MIKWQTLLKTSVKKWHFDKRNKKVIPIARSYAAKRTLYYQSCLMEEKHYFLLNEFKTYEK